MSEATANRLGCFVMIIIFTLLFLAGALPIPVYYVLCAYAIAVDVKGGFTNV